MLHKYLVELLGTLLISFVVFSTGNYLAIGAAVSLAILLGGVISGGAFNPAFAIALFYAGKLSANDLVPYIVAEIVGALAGFEIVRRFIKQ
jgi:glycerol uptake facilitator-like aquaporin